VKRFLMTSLTLLPFLTTFQMKADIAPVVEFASATPSSSPSAFTLGYEFALSSTFDINALGYYNDGLGDNHQVGIWSAGGTLIASTTVTGSDPVVGHFQYQSIPDLILGPGTYIIGGQYLGNGANVPILAQGVTSQAGYTWITDEQSMGAGLNFPGSTRGGIYGQNGLLDADFSGTVTPEPAEFLPVVFAGMGIGLMVLRRRKARSAVEKI
jgi:Domain of unknown function (DUF4082)